MSRGKAITVGLLTVWPFFYMILFIFGIANLPEGNDSAAMWVFGTIVVLHCLTMLDMLAVLVIYVVHAATSDRVARNQRALWIALLLFVNAFAVPVYWYLYMWRQPERRRYEPGAQVLG